MVGRVLLRREIYMRRLLTTSRWLPVVAMLGVEAVIIGVAPVSAAGSSQHNTVASRTSLAQAPMQLRMAARSALIGVSGPVQQAKLTARDGASGDLFGFAVAISNATAIVGAFNKGPAGAGAAYAFVRSGTSWSQQAELTATDGAAGDQFGTSVAITGSTAVVGAYRKDSGTGAAYIFVRSGTTWTQKAELTASDRAAGDGFGASVAISGSTVVVGATYHLHAGAAYVFVPSGTTWTQQAELTASDGVSNDNFGLSIGISGSTAVVGARFKNSNTGAAYIFGRSGTAWSQLVKLTASDGAANDYFGISVAISGTTVAVGAYGKTSFTGAAYTFTGSGATWTQQAKLIASDGASNDDFGISVSIAGSVVVVGSPGKTASTGAAYVFVRSGTTWSQLAKLTASDGASNDQFGTSVGVSGTSGIVGAYVNNQSRGAAYAFARL
jgi:nucleoside-specific outer membrane channel protein Tsx